MISQATEVGCRHISVHGITARIECADPQILAWFDFDFRTFLAPEAASPTHVRLAVRVEPAPESAIPQLDEVMHTPNFVCFERGAVRYVDYQGKALAIYDYEHDSGQIYCTNPSLAYERLYLTLLSRIGEKLDYEGLHRVHSLGIVYHDFGCLFLIPQGGGKTTLAMSLLAHPQTKLLSEDTPFIDRQGRVFPFPFRLGVTNGEHTEAIPERFKRIAERKVGGYKVLIDLDFFRDKIASNVVRNKYLFCGRWTSGPSPRMVQIGKGAAFRYLMRDCVFGLGLPQVIEFFLQSGLKNCLKKAFIAASRIAASLALASNSRCYQLYLCKDRAKNSEMIVKFLESGRT